jgi:phosphoglycolate phosphatase-like HAD superfamily hydrolase
MKKFSGVFFFFLILISSNVRAQNQNQNLWVYFDLGNTVISTKDMSHLKYMLGARDYMDELKREGFKIGIISNIPESWGMDYKEKLTTLKKIISEGWSEEKPFDWSVYDEIILPLKDNEMKPALILFQQAVLKANACPSIYVGESPKEITAAQTVGMAAKLFDENDPDLYVPIPSLKNFIVKNYQLEYDKNCL